MKQKCLLTLMLLGVTFVLLFLLSQDKVDISNNTVLLSADFHWEESPESLRVKMQEFNRYSNIDLKAVASYLRIYNNNRTGLLVLDVQVPRPYPGELSRIHPTWLPAIEKRLYTYKKVMTRTELQFFYGCMKRDQPMGSSPGYNYTLVRKLLQPVYSKTKAQNLKIPLVVHFTWFYKKDTWFYQKKKDSVPYQMKFYHMISLLAAHRKIKPDVLLFWYDVIPTGKWWDYAVKHIPNLLMVHRKAPVKIFNRTIKFPEHKSDVGRLEIILNLGGIYLDLDSIALRSMNPLRNFSAVQGLEYQISLANGIILGAPGNLFHWLHYLSYLKFNAGSWGGNSVVKGMDLSKKYPHLIHVDCSHIIRPNYPERNYLVRDGNLWDWSKHYTVHLYARNNISQFSELGLNRPNFLVGEIYRFVLNNTTVPNIHTRLEFNQLSWWQKAQCKDVEFSRGKWDCASLNKTWAKQASQKVRSNNAQKIPAKTQSKTKVILHGFLKPKKSQVKPARRGVGKVEQVGWIDPKVGKTAKPTMTMKDVFLLVDSEGESEELPDPKSS